MTTEPFIVPHCDEPVRIVYRDDTLLVVDKPAGLLSVPGRLPENRDCLISRVQQDFADARIVHRLDMATSGLMLLARDADSHRALSQLFQQRQVEKEYHAVVYSNLNGESGLIDLPLACDWPNRPRQQINFNYGKAAQTWYQRLSLEGSGHTRVLLKPVTGRSHQLRVHMASLGHPILGCEFYAHAAARAAANRLLLHASRLRFIHPQHGELMDMESSVPF